MSTVAVRAALILASIMLAALSSAPAVAELPTHRKVLTLRPLASEHVTDQESGFPIYSGFGVAVAIRNGVAFVGIPDAVPDSRVGVYGQTASGWVRTGTLTVQDPLVFNKDGFGRAIVFRDGVAVIASWKFVHVFKRVNGVWTDVQKFAPPPDSFDSFWRINDMRLENGILGIGSASTFIKGAAYVYELAANGKFQLRATLRASISPRPIDVFGSAVAVAGNVVVVGDPEQSIAYVFRRRSDGTWAETQRLIGADTSPVESFGAAVAIDQGMIIVGAPRHECLERADGFFCNPSGGSEPVPGGGAGGAAYVFTPIAGQYVQVLKLRPRADEHANYYSFGRRIAMMGKHVVIDAALQSTEGEGIPGIEAIPNGLSFSYLRDGSTLTARGITSGYVQSESMGLANNWLLVGAAHDPQEHCQNELDFCLGEASVFDLNRFR